MADYRAHARWDNLRRKMTMYVGMDHGNGEVTFISPYGSKVLVPPNIDIPEDMAWNIPSGAVHAVIEALSSEIGLTDGAKFQRADFEHERGRVDKLMDYMIGARQ